MPILPYLVLGTTAGLVVSVVPTLGTLFVMGITVLPKALGVDPPAG